MTGIEKLKLMSAWDTEPAVSEDDLEAVLNDHAVPDANGTLPASEGWIPTYDQNAAAAKVWLIKAARAAALTEVDPPGSGIVTSKVFENCMRMARYYRSKQSVTVGLR
jgi:hypothetical protein